MSLVPAAADGAGSRSAQEPLGSAPPEGEENMDCEAAAAAAFALVLYLRPS